VTRSTYAISGAPGNRALSLTDVKGVSMTLKGR
jgi:hypothetical protein